MNHKEFNIFVGYDSKTTMAYEVCKHTLKPYDIIPVKLENLYIYNRTDVNASTEFTLSRFLVPYLSNYEGWSLFCDNDFLWLCDPAEIFNLKDDRYSVMVVKHNYEPKSQYKMDGKFQHKFPRKNWSSLMLFNNGKCKILSPEIVNQSLPEYLHRFYWTTDERIGSLPFEYNWLVGYYTETETVKPKALHYTDGGPWFKEYENCEYSDVWIKKYNETFHNPAHGSV